MVIELSSGLSIAFKPQLAQGIKKLVSRALDWHVREQVEFNRQVMACFEATIEALNDTKRILARLDLAGLDRTPQDRRKLNVQRRRVEVINRHAATVTDQAKHA